MYNVLITLIICITLYLLLKDGLKISIKQDNTALIQYNAMMFEEFQKEQKKLNEEIDKQNNVKKQISEAIQDIMGVANDDNDR